MGLELETPSLLRTCAYINGKWNNTGSGRPIAVTNPATLQTVAHVVQAGYEETQLAIAAAQSSLPAWRALSAKTRAKLLRKWFELMMMNQDDLAKIITAEQGKVLSEARDEIAYGASYIEWFAEEAKRVYGDVIPGPSDDNRIICIKQPVGVVAAITPWNFPNAMIARKAAPALAAGCTIIVKPALETPLSALAMADVAQRAGIPAGVFNVVVGHSREIGRAIMESHVVRKLSFTGSTAVGKLLESQAATTMKKTSMELGGNAPFIVFDDADLDAAVSGLIASKFRNSGQTCVCTNRVFVQASVLEPFAKKLTLAVERLVVGNGMSEGVTTGPLVSERAAEDVHRIVCESIEGGAHAIVGGLRSDLGSCFYPPTILVNVTNDMPIAREEIFGPVVSMISFNGEEEVIGMANDTNVGLASYLYTRDMGRIWRVAESLECGIVGINEGSVSNEMAPFGGVKESGSGREGSKYGLDDYLEIKYMCLGGIDR